MWQKKSVTKRLPLPELRKRTKILVIDDDANGFAPFEKLKQEGYHIDYWERVQNLSQLEEGAFEIIFLDIQGVAQDWNKEEDGLAILQHLKERNPAQIVVAYSGQDFDVEKTRFFEMADDQMAKPAVSLKCKQVIDSLMEEKLNFDFYWQSVESLLASQNLSAKEISTIRKKVIKAAAGGNTKAVEEVLSQASKVVDIVTKLVVLAGKISTFMG